VTAPKAAAAREYSTTGICDQCSPVWPVTRRWCGRGATSGRAAHDSTPPVWRLLRVAAPSSLAGPGRQIFRGSPAIACRAASGTVRSFIYSYHEQVLTQSD
jgi:hypothetical protein